MSDDLGELLASMVAPPQQGPSPYAVPGNYSTQLQPLDEMAFRQWVAQNNVPFNPNAQQTDYDMRGFYRGMQQQHPRATSAINPNDQQMHYPDFWKLPTHRTFSQDSQWAQPVAPRWNEQDQLISPGGRILFDERR
jgi:hypothetical protein